MNEIFDVIVIGGGPSGIMSAGFAGKKGAKVLLIEKNPDLGRKILITGKGRCNVTQAEFNLKNLVAYYGQNGRFLFSSLHRFGPEEVINFFENLGVKLKVERGGRVFPESDSAKEIVDSLKKFLKQNNVLVWTNSEVKKILTSENKITEVCLKDGQNIKTKNLIIATGGLSYPLTGSTGNGYKWAKELKHNVIFTEPALTPLKIKEKWVKELSGLSLKNVELSAWQSVNNKKIASRFGEMLFTHFGVSGPIVLDISKTVIKAEKEGNIKLKINLKPALTDEQLDDRLLRDFKKNNKKLFKNSLDELLPKQLILTIVELSGIDPEKSANSITKKERLALRKILRGLEITVIGNMGYDLAIVTSGGIDLKEIDPMTMRSKKYDNLYFVGEVLDIDGPTGGYNLQSAWATGYMAGNSVEF